MATIKSYTDIEQSKKLAEILPLESADMVYIKRAINDTFIETPIVKPEGKIPKSLPCWSLAALLYVIPKSIKYYNVLRIDISENEFSIWYDEIAYGVNNDLPDITKDNLVDACVAMIESLNELNLL